MQITGPWLTAARWSSRLDFAPLIDALDRGPQALARAGAPPAFVREAAACHAVEAGEPLRLDHPSYPDALRQLPMPPPLLWLRGDRGVLELPSLAIVGARSCTPYGRGVASKLAVEVARRQGAVASGGARGIDAAAHRACLAEGGRTVAVLGGGLDSGFTDAQRALHRAILEGGGLLLSEQAPCDPARRWTFPRRNRLIAALSRATVVVEAGERSGALHTARAASGLGKEVFAVPGRLGEPASVGCLGLLAQGATVVRSIAGVADVVGAPMSALVAGALPATPLELAAVTGQEVRAVLGLLAMLELRGIVRPMPDGRYVLT